MTEVLPPDLEEMRTVQEEDKSGFNKCEEEIKEIEAQRMVGK